MKKITMALLATSGLWALPVWAQASEQDLAPEGLQDIVVTAQKREQRLQEVPISITAITGDSLTASGIDSSRDLSQVTPGLNFSQSSFNAQPYIRGVGTRNVTAGDESNVPIYIDGIYQSLMQAGFFELSNIERIEVLKGPQGTLFGRNALGGAISVITKAPSFDPEGKAMVRYGRFADKRGSLYLTSGITDTIAASISLQGADDQGWLKDRISGQRLAETSSVSARGKLLWLLSDSTQLRIGANILRSQDNTAFSGFPLDGNTSALRGDPNVVIGTGDSPALSFRPFFNLRQHGGDATLVSDFDNFQLTILGSYQKNRYKYLSDSDVSPRETAFLDVGLQQRAYTSEVRAVSTGSGPLGWIVGAFYYNGGSHYPRARLSPTSTITSSEGSRAYALFSEVSYELGERLSLIGGLRYSSEKRNVRGVLNGNEFARDSASFDDISPRASVRYELTPRTNVYATYSQGFKSGVFNTSQTTAPIQLVSPEKLKSFEIGIKSDPTATLRINASGYRYNYENLQVSARDASGSQTLQNAASARIYGADLSVEARVAQGLTLTAGYAYTHARYKDFKNALQYVRRPDGAGNLVSFVDASGQPLQRSPDHTANLSADYRVDVGGGELQIAGNVSYNSGFTWDPLGRLKQDAFGIVNGHISWAPESEGYRITLFGRNLSNTRNTLVIVESLTADNTALARPWSAGVRLELNF